MKGTVLWALPTAEAHCQSNQASRIRNNEDTGNQGWKRKTKKHKRERYRRTKEAITDQATKALATSLSAGEKTNRNKCRQAGTAAAAAAAAVAGVARERGLVNAVAYARNGPTRMTPCIIRRAV